MKVIRVFSTAVLAFIGVGVSSAAADAAHDFDITVITHGRADRGLDTTPLWMIDLAESINSQRSYPETPTLLEQSVVRYGTANTASSSKFLLYDWTQGPAQGDPQHRVSSTLCDAILDKIERQKEDYREKGVQLSSVDIHFIGDREGASINADVLITLQLTLRADFLRFVQTTSFDAKAFYPETLVANPAGLVDWQTNYFSRQTATPAALIPEGANVELSSVIEAWNNLTNSPANSSFKPYHWYLWSFHASSLTTNPREIKFRDPGNQVIQAALRQDSELIKLLFGSHVVSEDFAEGTLRSFDLHGCATMIPGYVQLTPPRQYELGGMIAQGSIREDSVIDFSFVITEPGGWSQGDRVMIVLLPAPTDPLETAYDAIKNRGYKGAGTSFAVVFDTYWNTEFGDPRDPWNYVGLLRDGNLRYHALPGGLLPEAAYSGNVFRVRVVIRNRTVFVDIYSHGQDRSTSTQFPLTAQWIKETRGGVKVAFLAETGAGYQRHSINDVMIAPVMIP